MKEKIKKIITESIKYKHDFLNGDLSPLMELILQITKALKSGNKLLICGNGGSAADSQHIATEFVVRL
ncbi:MAG: SIS domain-containing protein, partial [bacterium]|nr:SIS domain-containing protein [bacterium]